jgi:1-aminocyclopropane-1-carboxylate synthase
MALMRFCEQKQIHLVSDEVYALSVFKVQGRDTQGFTSSLSIDPRGLIRTDRVHVLYGLSKVPRSVQKNPPRELF